MKIVIIGLGIVGKTILKMLSQENHTITIIDENKKKIEDLIEKFDVLGLVGNGACMDIQKDAGVKDADVVIACTESDELNIFACMVAKNLGVKNTIARVRNHDYRNQIEVMRETLGISMLVNPEKDTANEIFNLINLPSVVQVDYFAKGKVLLVGIVAENGNSLIGESLKTLNSKLSTRILICAVQRGDEVFIPTGDFVIEEGDKLHFTTDIHMLRDFLEEIDLVKSPLRNIMIVGGCKTSAYLAELLSKRRYKVKLIEKDKEVAEELAGLLPKVTVVNGNGTRHDVLYEEGIDAMDAFVSLSDIDEENMVVSMFANKMKVKKIITQIKDDDLVDMLDELGIHNNVSTKYVVADRVVSYIRALENEKGSNVLTLSHLVNDKVEVLEFLAKVQEEDFYNKPLKELKVKEDCLIACIIRNGQVIVPDGDTSIQQGDNVIVVTTHKSFDDLTDVFK